MFPVISLPNDAPNLPEQLGTKEKFWFRDDQGVSCLFKEGRPNSGDDWSEKVACELCELLGIPHAAYDFATFRDRRGVVTPTFVPEGCRLVHGNELLAAVDNEYPQRKFFRVAQHTLSRVLAFMRHAAVNLPIDSASFDGVETALDFFCRLFDARCMDC